MLRIWHINFIIMKNFLLSFALFCAFSASSFAEVVSLDYARTVAGNFYSSQYLKANQKSCTAHIISEFTGFYESDPAYYIFGMSDNGFVILTADNRVFPIIGYSFENRFDPSQTPEQLEALLNAFANQINFIRQSETKNSYEKLWSDIYNNKHTKDLYDFKTVPALLTTKWNQGYPYNNYCPEHFDGPHGRCYAGCVATAMAQVIKYHNYPEHGNGTHDYFWGDIYTVDYENTYYHWEEMTNSATTSSADAIAELTFHCAVSVDMNFGPYGSSSYTEWVPDALKNYFNYRPSIRFKDRVGADYDPWDMMVRDNLDNGLPLIYSGQGSGGHAFVCDGYQDTCYYHFNWGWSGYGDGWYYYNDLTPPGNDFSYYQGAVFDIAPYFAPYCADGKTMIEYNRNFGDGSGMSFYWNNTSCEWLIAPMADSAEYISLWFNSFNTELGKDILYIYDGADETAPLIKQCSGGAVPTGVTSTGNTLFLKFVTDSINQFPGWEATYMSGAIGINELSSGKPVKIYPNPASSIVTLETPGKADCTILDLHGKTIRKFSGTGKELIDVSGLTKGIYFIRVVSAEYFGVVKLVVE